MSVSIVTGLAFGDESKGSTVDFLARQGKTVVVRHNGGPQCGHNVVTKDGLHHEFSQFGSGTLAGATTFLSKFMLINPLNMVREADHLIELGETDIWQRTFVDEEALVITPYHTAYNRLEEEARGDGRHGSCGQGVGAAMWQDVSNPACTLQVKHLCLGPGLPDRLEKQREYLMQCAARNGHTHGPHFEALCDSTLTQWLAERYRNWYTWTHIVHSGHLKTMMASHEHTVFEGAQGVLLDEWYGFHPFTTWSTTTPENALTLCDEAGFFGEIKRLGVMRAYMTRHGPGPFVTEDPAVSFSEPHNSDGPWQGGFRQGHLDLVALRYALKVCGGVDQLVVTHLDRTDSWKYCTWYGGDHDLPVSKKKGDLDYQADLTKMLGNWTPTYADPVSTDALLPLIEQELGVPVGLASYGPTAADKGVMAEA